MDRRAFLSSLLPNALATIVASPVLAQDMGENGISIPSFLFSRQERMAREACENNSPNCRPEVRRQMALERDFSLLTPWLMLGLGVIALLLYMRKKEKQKDIKRRIAQRKHVAGGFNKMGQTEGEVRSERALEDERFG